MERAVLGLLTAGLPPANQAELRQSGSHFVCEVLELITVVIDKLLKVPGQVIDEVVNSLPLHWIPAAAGRAILKHLAAAVIAADPQMVMLDAMATRTATFAILLCPDDQVHASLTETCRPRYDTFALNVVLVGP